MNAFPSPLMLLILVSVPLIAASVRIVQQQNATIVERFGKYARTLHPGLNFIIPGIERVVRNMDLRVQPIETVVEVKTQDNMFVRLPVTLMIKVIPDRAADAWYQLSSPAEQISAWVLNTLRSTTSAMNLKDLFEDRKQLVDAVESTLVERLANYGFKVEDVLIDQPSVSEEVQRAFNRVVASEREKEAATQEAEAKRIKIVGEARADAESQQLRAEGLANARQILARGLLDASKTFDGSPISPKEALDVLVEINRLDTIRHAAQSGKLVLMDVKGDIRPTLPVDSI